MIPRGFDLPTLGTVSRQICPQDHGTPLFFYNIMGNKQYINFKQPFLAMISLRVLA